MSPDNNSNPPAGNNNNNSSPPMENNNNSNPLTGNNNANTNTISLLPPSPSTTSFNSPASTQSSVTLGPLQGAFPNGIRITERIMSDPSWPSDLMASFSISARATGSNGVICSTSQSASVD
ncbi:hypothetical protein BGY98DRAFT_1098716 [Russula aff. rugulosa BPL654]|nr:hypothetical protein BGY98DRAFT_1098716 [Russula aff. rugulosa BPL654]